PRRSGSPGNWLTTTGPRSARGTGRCTISWCQDEVSVFLDDVIHEPDDVDLAVLDALAALGFHPTDEPPTPDCVIGERIHPPAARPLPVTPPPRPEEYAPFAPTPDRPHRPPRR